MHTKVLYLPVPPEPTPGLKRRPSSLPGNLAQNFSSCDVCMCVCMYPMDICMYACMDVWYPMDICIYGCMDVCMHGDGEIGRETCEAVMCVCVCIYTHTHTHTFAHTQTSICRL